jgi:UDP-N-acetylmuramoyl-L-alanyl-D-glutamate--2,6-diaminopimelate ligase
VYRSAVEDERLAALMKLDKLLPAEVPAPAGGGTIEVTGLAADSRAVVPGALFAALPGANTEGARFAVDAVAKGAVAVLAGEDAALPSLPVPVLRAADPRRALALMAARFYDRQPAVAVAVTGTNGKTSVAEFTRQIFARLGRKAASLGTIGLVKADGSVYGALTTPDPVSLHATLAGLAREGVTHLAFEASSHGLDQRRLDGVRLSAGAFLNLGRDHLDYHGSTSAYFDAKLRLFRELMQPGQTVVVNLDGGSATLAKKAAEERGLNVMTTGANGQTLRLAEITRTGFEQRVTIEHGGKNWPPIKLPLLGSYQASNALVAAALAMACGEPAREAIDALADLKGVKGRLEVVGPPHNGGIAVVDYAHKPEALEAALDALRPFATRRLICVFGCGGDRDKGKRAIMGQIAARKANVVIVTDDNPRSEHPAAIRSQILAGAPGAREIGDRAEAIRAAIAMMGPGDVVLIAGKGHESGQIVGTTVIPFLDHDAVRAAMGEARG